ncbi:MAG: hypothetical protein CL913_04815 [Deltaproteobacteria bacterium]|nr:hypothetical protein [Deltaproteobacteria bacterium]
MGLKNNNPGLGEFLQDRSGRLTNLPIPTFHPNLQFLLEDWTAPYMADLNVMYWHGSQHNYINFPLRSSS